LASCSSGGGGGGGPTGTTYEITDRPFTPLTMANLAGTWSFINKDPIEKTDTNGAVIARGSTSGSVVYTPYGDYFITWEDYVTSVSDPTDSWMEYAYEKGTYSCDENNIIKHTTGNIYSARRSPILDLENATWDSTSTSDSTLPYMIYQDQLYYYAFHRVGTGSGINGTWQTGYSYGSGSSFVHRVVITDTTYTEYTGQDVDSLSLHASATYTLIDDNTLHVSSDKYGEYDIEVILCGDKLAMLNMVFTYNRQ
jgi:hypothetical protein